MNIHVDAKKVNYEHEMKHSRKKTNLMWDVIQATKNVRYAATPAPKRLSFFVQKY